MNWAQGLLDNEEIFPNKIGASYQPCEDTRNLTRILGVPFPKNFKDTIRTLFRRLFRVYAHLYSNHFDHICALGIEGAYRVYGACFHRAQLAT